MTRTHQLLATVLLAGGLPSLAHAAGPQAEARANWPAWRGPMATGEAPKGKPPTQWSEEKNVRWKVEIPGRSHASPIIWGDRVFVLTAVETSKEPAQASAPPTGGDGEVMAVVQDPPPRRGGRRAGPPGAGRRGGGGRDRSPPKHVFEFRALALDRKSGKTQWSTVVKEERPHESGHPDASQASNSPVTDGRHLYAYFGSRGLYCLDMKGKVKWKADFGIMQTRHEFGEGSSPALYGDTIVVNWDHEGDDFIVALDKNTGKERWRVARDEHTTWSTPIIVDANGKRQVVVNATNFIRAYDLATGREVWRCKGMTDNVSPSPMVGGDLLYAISGFRGAACLAIKYREAKGDITDSKAIAWKYDKNTPYVPSALLYRGRLYFLDNNKPILSCLDAKTGKALYGPERLEGLDSIYASLVGADGKVYVVGRNGTTLALKDGPKFKRLATNTLEDQFDASPAIAGSELYLRGRQHLYCIAEN
jgi:outer membrane protein assembly factor BamB